MSIMVVSIPLAYIGIGYVYQRSLPNDKTPFVHWSGLDPHTEVYVTWETSEETGSFIAYGANKNDLGLFIENREQVTLHRFLLTGLAPDTRYYYRAGPSSSTPSRELCGIQSFKTAPYVSDEFNVTLISDTQEVLGIGFYNTIGNAIKKNSDTDFVVNAGDLTQIAESQSLWNLYFDESPYLDQIPLVPCPGNHEVIENPDSKYFKYFGATENNRDVYYSFEWGNALFVIAQIGSRGHVDPDDPSNTEHFRWLKETLEAGQDKDYRILIYHINRLEIMAPIVEKYNVSLVIHGHAHQYTRYYFNQHTYVCLGNGATIQDERIEEEPYAQKKTNAAGFTRLTFNPIGIKLETFTPTMDIMDHVFLRREESSGLLIPDVIRTNK